MNESLLMIQLPFRPADIDEIEEINKAAKYIVSPYDKNILSPHSIKSYLFQKHLHHHEIRAVFDRNIISELTNFARNSSNRTDSTKKTLALLAFLQIALVDVEPGIAISEYCATSYNPIPDEELFLFRKIDNLPTQYLVDLALGRNDCLDLSKTLYNGEREEVSRPDRSEDVHLWKVQFVYSLKLYLLANSYGDKFEKIRSFIYWMWEEYLSGAVAFSFVAIFFSEKYGKMLKGVNSNNPEKAMHGIRNAAWDMATTHFWTNAVAKRKGNDPFLIFCTADKALNKVSKYIIEQTEKPDKEKLFNNLFGNYLNNSEINELLSLKNELDHREYDSKRNVVKYGDEPHFFDNYLEKLEKEAKEIMKKKPNKLVERDAKICGGLSGARILARPSPLAFGHPKKGILTPCTSGYII
jgi:hypothetical protein